MRYRYRTDNEMKDSGIEWLGKIPRRWEKLRLKNITDSIKNGIWGENEQKDMNDIPCIRIANFNREKNNVNFEDLTIRNLEREKQKDYLLNENDLLIEKSGGGEKQPVGFTVIYNNDLPAIYANFMARIKIKERHYSQYILYSFRSLYDKRINVKYIKQTTGIQNLDTENYFNEKIYTPPHQEQQKIASFLDKKTAEFDTIIEKKQSLITKLTEAKKSLISEVVTGKKEVIPPPSLPLSKGEETGGGWQVISRADDEMKDSGVEWLGKIPKEWEVGFLKYYLLEGREGIKIGPFGSSLKLDEMKENYPIKVYGQENLINEDFSLGSRFISQEKFNEMKNYELFADDIAISMMGTIGKSMVVSKNIEKGIMDSHLIRIRLNCNLVLVDFINLIIRYSNYIKEQINLSSKGSIMSGLNSSIIKNLKLIIPNLQEQQLIVDFLDEKTAKIDSTIEKINLQIEKLKEAKQSLISEAVTGKIEVL